MIRLRDIFPLTEPQLYKLHLVRPADHLMNPFAAFDLEPLGDPASDAGRSRYRLWLRRRIFVLNQDNPRHNTWLFGGAFHVVECGPYRYELEDCEQFHKYVGRVSLRLRGYPWLKARVLPLEDYADDFEVVEVTPSLKNLQMATVASVSRRQ